MQVTSLYHARIGILVTNFIILKSIVPQCSIITSKISPLFELSSVFMAKDKEPKRLCCCGCGKLLSARAECRHHDGKVPPRIAAVQKNQSKVLAGPPHLIHSIKSMATSTAAAQAAGGSNHINAFNPREEDDINMEQDFFRVSSPMDIILDDDPVPPTPVLRPPTVVLQDNISVSKAKAAVWTDWRAQRENVAISDDEDGGLPRLAMTEDDEDSDPDEDREVDEDSEPDSQSVDDDIEAEWEKEWAEMGE